MNKDWCIENDFAAQNEITEMERHNSLMIWEENKSLRARVMKLEKVLRPFVDESYRYDPDEDDDNQTAYDTYIKIGQLRAARHALEEK